MSKIPCKKCLLADIEPGEELRKINELIAMMPEREKASNKKYEIRLNSCRECAALAMGTCMECGCYVELRAMKNNARCPRKKW